MKESIILAVENEDRRVEEGRHPKKGKLSKKEGERENL